MKQKLLLAVLVSSLASVNAQEQLPREDALRLAFAVSVDLAQLQGTPIPSDVDLKRPIALRSEDYGGLLLPEAKLSLQAIMDAGEKVVPVGQLWLHRLTPMRNGEPVYPEKLRMAKVYYEGEELRTPQCALAVRKNAGGKLELLVYGKTAEPVVTVPLEGTTGGGGEPVKLSAERDSFGATATLVFFGKYKAELALTEIAY